MSYYAGLDTHKQIQIASNGGWADFAAWVDGLDNTYADLIHLVEHGWDHDLQMLTNQLKRALKKDPPPVDGVAEIGEELIAFLMARGDAEALVIGQGFEGDPD